MSAQADKEPGSSISKWYKFCICWLQILLPFFLNPYKIYWELWKRPEKIKEPPNRSGQVAVITGATGNIGSLVLKKLLQSQFQVILGCRSLTKGGEIVAKIRADGVTTGSTKVIQLDLQSLKSVREFATTLLQQVDRIDLLINNAGIMFCPYRVTEDGYESQFQTNYLSHFLLTHLLLDKMKATGKVSEKEGRIVNVSSEMHFGGNLDFQDLETCKIFSGSKSYCDSKLCLVLQARYLDHLLRSKNEKVSVYSVHPGVCSSDLWINASFITKLFHFFFKWTMKTVEHGAETILYAALSPKLEGRGGLYINTCEIYKPHKQVENVEIQKKLWKRSLELVNL